MRDRGEIGDHAVRARSSAPARQARLLSTTIFLLVAGAAVLLAYQGYRSSLALYRAHETERVEAAEREASSLVDRVEQTLIDTENVIFHLLGVEGDERFLSRWGSVAASVPLARSVAVLETDGNIRVFASKRAGDAYKAFELVFAERVVPGLPLAELESKPGFLKHVHVELDGRYYLFAIQPNLRAGRMLHTVLELDTGTVVGDIFVKTFSEPAKTLRLAVTNDHGEAVYGERFDSSKPHTALVRFPTTLYRWKLHLEPVLPAAGSWFDDSLNVSALFIALALVIIIVGLLALAQAIRRARIYARLQADFVSHVSHELRTPLSLIRMFGELLALGKVSDPERAEEYYRIIMRESERLSRLIDNVLDFSRLERGSHGLDMRPVELAPVVREVAQVFQPRLEQEGRELVLAVQDDLPLVLGDVNALGLALYNLVDNALKYSHGEGAVRVALESRPGRVRLSVTDRGSGIPEEHLNRVFDRFYRAPQDPKRRAVRGTGIGLALVKAIASQHKGRVSASSDPDEGTTFTLDLPALESTKELARGKAGNAAATLSPDSPRTLEPHA